MSDDEVVGPVPADGVTHDLAEDRLVAAWSDMPALRKHRQTEEHGPEDPAEEKLGPLRPHRPRLLEDAARRLRSPPRPSARCIPQRTPSAPGGP